MANPISGKTVVTTAGTAVTLGSGTVVYSALMIKALASNTGVVYVGNDGAHDVSSANGFELSAGEVVVFDYPTLLIHIMLDAAVSGEGVCWLSADHQPY